MINRTRILQLKRIESDPDETIVRLTSPNGEKPNDTFVVVQASNDDLKQLIDQRGKLFRVTIEEVPNG